MNTKESEPITGPGLLWAIDRIQKQFEKALTPVKKIESTPEDCASREEESSELKH